MEKELLNKNINLLIKTIKEEKKHDYYAEQEKTRQLIEQYKNNKEELKRIFQEQEEQARKEQEQEKRRSIKENILIDNIHYLINATIFEDIKEYFKQYENKNIGEKTQEKIKEELTKIIQEKYNNKDISFYITRRIKYNNFFEYRFLINIDSVRYHKVNDNILMYFDCDDGKFSLYRDNNYLDYVMLNKINNHINYIIKNVNKLQAEKEKLNNKIKEFNNTIYGVTKCNFGVKEC